MSVNHAPSSTARSALPRLHDAGIIGAANVRMSFPLNTYAEVDTTALPLVVVRVVGPITDESYSAYLEELLAAAQLRERVVMRLHAGPLLAFPPRFVRATVAWMKKHDQVLNHHVVAVSIVMDSTMLRLAAEALAWAGKPPFPMGAASTAAQADTWLFEHLERDHP